MSGPIDGDLLETWKRHQATPLIWEQLCRNFNPWSMLLACDPSDTKKYQGQAEVLEALREYMAPDKS